MTCAQRLPHDCEVAGTLEGDELEPYLEGIEEALKQWGATMHFMVNHFTVDGDRGHVETWSLAHRLEADGSPIDDLILALHYQDHVVRVGDDWKIIRRNAERQLHATFARSPLEHETTLAHVSAIVAAIVAMTHELDLPVVAEGVKTPEQLAKLRSLGCDLAQGFLFGRPTSPEAIERLLVEGRPLQPRNETELDLHVSTRRPGEIETILSADQHSKPR